MQQAQKFSSTLGAGTAGGALAQVPHGAVIQVQQLKPLRCLSRIPALIPLAPRLHVEAQALQALAESNLQ